MARTASRVVLRAGRSTRHTLQVQDAPRETSSIATIATYPAHDLHERISSHGMALLYPRVYFPRKPDTFRSLSNAHVVVVTPSDQQFGNHHNVYRITVL